MSVSLSELSIGVSLQALAGFAVVLDKGREHWTALGADPDELVSRRIWPDMLPLSYQVACVAHYSAGALEGLRSGVYRPPEGPGPQPYGGLQALVRDAHAAVRQASRDEIDALADRDVVFALGPQQLTFGASAFLLSLVLPNLHFHATTAYDILRGAGVPLGKLDYIGPLRITP